MREENLRNANKAKSSQEEVRRGWQVFSKGKEMTQLLGSFRGAFCGAKAICPAKSPAKRLPRKRPDTDSVETLYFPKVFFSLSLSLSAVSMTQLVTVRSLHEKERKSE